ncbi:hypothetical protein PISMIDRAFT_689849, partial [Pisolithus microcarpus 441]
DFPAQVIQYEVEEDQNQSQASLARDRVQAHPSGHSGPSPRLDYQQVASHRSPSTCSAHAPSPVFHS